MYEDYQWRNIDKNEFELLYNCRQNDENTIIKESINMADFIIRNYY